MTNKPRSCLLSHAKTAEFVGAVLTLAATLIVFRLFFGPGMLSNAGRNLFSMRSEDMLKDIYTTTYHTKYDQSVAHCTAMAYPYGEHYTYTGLQILVSAPLQLLQKMGVHDAWKACLPLINFYVILSILLCSLFLYLLFLELKLPPIPALFGAVFVTFLMPQLMRLGGHLTLSYLCVIPMALYFIARLHATHHWKWSVLYGVLLLFSALSHPYYMAFMADISVIYMAYLLFTHKKNQWRIPQLVLHFFIQFILPVAVFFLLSSIGDSTVDRTSVADGMFYYRGCLYGLLLPFHRLFMIAPLRNMGFMPPEWETCCYVGIVALIALLVWVLRILWGLIHLRVTHLFRPTDNSLLNVFLWASVLLFLLASVLPIITMKHPDILNHLSVLAQLRAMGRLLWLPFVTLNVLAVYWVWQWISSFRKTGYKVVVLLLVCMAYGYEIYAYSLLATHSEPYPQWTDYDNKLPDNQWVSKINTEDYQAILSLPVFHVGSEHYTLLAQDDAFKINTYVSFKTGLPLICGYGSRSSISRSYNCIELSWEPWKDYNILQDLPDERPLLVVSMLDQNRLNLNEKRILSYADSLFSTDRFSLYRLPVSQLHQLCQDYQAERKRLYYNGLNEHSDYYIQSWDERKNGLLAAKCNRPVCLYDDTIDHAWGDSICVSFWITNYLQDMMGRNLISISAVSGNGAVTNLAWNTIGSFVTAIDWEAGLISIPVCVPDSAVRMCIVAGNNSLPTRQVFYDRLLIAPQGKDVAFPYVQQGDTIKLLNNIPLR